MTPRLIPLVAALTAMASIATAAETPLVIRAGELTTLSSPAKSLQLRTQTLRYRLGFSKLPLLDAARAPQASISAISYVRQVEPGAAKRPVVFAWGGGPGGSSADFAFHLLGPVLVDKRAQAVTVTDNPDTLLDVADIVVIDAVGTGLSQVAGPEGGKPYWGVKGDALAVDAFIRQWLKANDRLDAPVYLMGISYGGYRMGEVAALVGDLNIAGLALAAPGLNLQAMGGDLTAVTADPDWNGGVQADQAFINNLPSMAVTAFAHGRIDKAGRSVDQLYEQARAFAQGDYAAALQLGSLLPAEDRDRLSQRMSALIGLPAQEIVQANLRVFSQTFLEHLIPGSVVGRLDTRVVAPLPPKDTSGRIAAANDPSLGMIGVNVRTSSALTDYLRRETGVKTTDDYVELNLNVNFAWDWSPHASSLEANIAGLDVGPNLAKLLRAKPQARLLLMSGYYDLAIPALSSRNVLTHIGAPADRVTMRLYESGHGIGQDPINRPKVLADLHAFIAGSRP